MTTTFTPLVPPASTTTVSTARWALVAEGLWAGTREGEFLGTVEFVDGGFETADERGTRIGRSHSLAAAQRLVDEPADVESVLTWSDERRTLMVGWLGFAGLATAAVMLAVNLFA